MNETLNVEKPPGSASAICSPVKVALSIRQPWAWLIVEGFKDIENRTWPTRFRGRVLIHAGKTMTRADYEACAIFWQGCELSEEVAYNLMGKFPTFEMLQSELGGIVGEAEITGCVTESPSPWFVGEYGFVIKNAKRTPFRKSKGALGFYNPGNDKLFDL
jgi:hypothetical protein